MTFEVAFLMSAVSLCGNLCPVVLSYDTSKYFIFHHYYLLVIYRYTAAVVVAVTAVLHTIFCVMMDGVCEKTDCRYSSR